MTVHTPLDSEQQREFSALLGKILRDDALRLHTGRIVPGVAGNIPSLQVAPEDYRLHLIAQLEKQALRDEFIDALLSLDETRRWRADLLKFRSQRDVAAGDDCPYPGLAAYRPGDHARFFGRRAESGELFALLGEGRWLWVEGASGAGKSSLVAAGLLPLLERGGAVWKVAGMRPGVHPLDNLARALSALAPGRSLASLTHDLTAGPAGLRAFVRERTPAGARFMLWIDQLEESQTFADAEQAQQFDRLIAAALDDEEPRFHLVTTIRVDQIGGFLAGMRELGRRINHPWVKRYAVRSLDVDALDEVIARPAATRGRSFQDGLVVTIRKDAATLFARGTGGLPLLAHALRELWLECAGAPELNAAAYDRLGGLTGALTRSAEEALVQLEKLDPSARARVRGLLLALATVDRQGRWTRKTIARQQALAALGGDKPEVLIACLSGQSVATERPPMRFVTTLSHNDEARVDLIHEVLLTSWPTLQRWLGEVEDAKRGSAALHDAAVEWRDTGSQREGLQGGLLREKYLAAAPDVEPALDDAFQAALRAEAEAEEAAQRREEELARQRRRQAIAAIVALSLLSLGLIYAVVEAVLGQHNAEKARDRANKIAEDLQRTNGALGKLLHQNLAHAEALVIRVEGGALGDQRIRSDLLQLSMALMRDFDEARQTLLKSDGEPEAINDATETAANTMKRATELITPADPAVTGRQTQLAQDNARIANCEDTIVAAEKATTFDTRLSLIKQATECQRQLLAPVHEELRSKVLANNRRIVRAMYETLRLKHDPSAVLEVLKRVEKLDLAPDQRDALALIRGREVEELNKRGVLVTPREKETSLDRKTEDFDAKVKPRPGQLPGGHVPRPN